MSAQSFLTLRKDLDRIAARRRSGKLAASHLARVHTGYEFRTDPGAYRWHGTRRGGDPKHPLVLFQYTIDGAGAFWSKGQNTVRIAAGDAFTAIIPSEHEYYLPKDSAGWRFVWLIINHPYIASRIGERQRATSPIWSVPANCVLAGLTIRIHEAVESGACRDPFEEEQLLFEFLIAYERFARELEHPVIEREAMLRAVRMVVERNLRSAVRIDEIAAGYGMSRSHFSHRFQRVTGIAPAQYILQVRLGHVCTLLKTSHLKLEAVAAETGFANATHLCRVFRKYYHLSPDSFRRQTTFAPSDHG